VLTVLVAAPGSHAQVGDDDDADFTVTGKVVAVDLKASTLTVKGPDDDGDLYHVNAMTIIMSGTRSVDLSALKVGETVVLNSDVESGEKVATYIEVVGVP
jgi:Cu/Ag efflux protein CusF